MHYPHHGEYRIDRTRITEKIDDAVTMTAGSRKTAGIAADRRGGQVPGSTRGIEVFASRDNRTASSITSGFPVGVGRAIPVPWKA